MKTMPYFQGTGSRKTSVARVRLVPGEGTIVVNGKPLEEYFGRDGYSEAAVQPFVVTNTARRFNERFDHAAFLNRQDYNRQQACIKVTYQSFRRGCNYLNNLVRQFNFFHLGSQNYAL